MKYCVLLAENNIPAHKVEQTASLGGGGGPKIVLWDVTVSSENVEQAMHILNANGLPRRSSQNLLTLFSASGLVPSEMAEKIRYRVGLADTIANLLCRVDGIVDADVELSYPKQDVLEPTAKLAPITASVFVKHTGVLDDPNSHLTSKIKLLVSAAVSGLSYNNVTVIADRAKFAIPSSVAMQVSTEEYNEFLGFTIEQSSLVRFQIFFYLTCLLLVILLLCFAWLMWKIYPILQRRGGITQLFHITPLPLAEVQEETTRSASNGSKIGKRPKACTKT